MKCGVTLNKLNKKRLNKKRLNKKFPTSCLQMVKKKIDFCLFWGI